MPEEQQHKRSSQSQTLSDESFSSKKTRAASSSSRSIDPTSIVVVKPEPGNEQGTEGPRTRAAAAAAGQIGPAVERARVNISFEIHRFHCDVAGCFGHLRPPVFMCEAGHLLCDTCRGEGHCGCCNRVTTFVRSAVAERFIDGARVPCPYEAAGCNSSVVYYDILAHRDACAYAPCCCLAPGCIFAASPPMLRDHLAADHSWTVHTLPAYKKAYTLSVPAEESRRLLIVEGDEPRVFLLSLRWRGEVIAVSVTCVRASAAAGPHFVCTLWVEGPTPPDAPRQAQPVSMMKTGVANCAAPGGDPDLEAGMWLYLMPDMMLGPSGDVTLSIRIDEIR